uniref:Ubiquitin-like domain-containing protein n=1 Tax=Trypanosoma congolense (strain IL3000) TaxID=1068625 RepID=G0UXA8_TRYCI|nr:conserved hypothetical protein [Trypanosoma congolense IL3000]
MDDKQAFFVMGVDGRTFKMVIRGDLGKLSVGKIRRYLKSYGVQDGMQLLFNGTALTDDQVGHEFGLCNNATLNLAPVESSVQPPNLPIKSRGRSDSSASLRRTDIERGRDREQGGTSPPPRNTNSREYQTKAQKTQDDMPDRMNHVDPERAVVSKPATRCSFSKGGISPVKTSNERSSTPEPATRSRRTQSEELETQQLREEVELLRQELRELKNERSASYSGVQNNIVIEDVLQNAKANLRGLGEELGVTLNFDSNLTCVVGNDESHTVLVTFDSVTERLYIYATLLTQLPLDPEVRAKLYELLLEGSLLSREVCGGGIGISPQNGVVLLSTTIPLRHCTSSTLRDIMPVFVETVQRWRLLINELLS